MLHDVGVPEMVPQGKCSLNPRISQRTDFLTVETAPLPTIELRVKIKNEFGVDEIDKSIADIAGIVVVDGEIKEIKLDPVMF